MASLRAVFVGLWLLPPPPQALNASNTIDIYIYIYKIF